MKPSKPQPEHSPNSGTQYIPTVCVLLELDEPPSHSPASAERPSVPSQSKTGRQIRAKWTCPHCSTAIPARTVIRSANSLLLKIILCPECGQPLQFTEGDQLEPLPPVLELEFWSQYPHAVEMWRDIERRRRARAFDAAIRAEVKREERECPKL